MFPHKTGTTGGPQRFGFPDSLYLPLASQAFDRLGIPNDPQVCCQWILQNQASLSMGPHIGNEGLAMMAGPVAALPATRVAQGISIQASAPYQDETLYYDADPSSSIGNTANQYSKYLEIVLIGKEEGKEEECPICLESIVPTSEGDTTDVVCIKKCQHRFHKHCIMDMFESHNKCPTCREPVGEPRGQGPSGSMNIGINHSIRCKGFEHNSDGVIELHYKFQRGVQLAFMENPGQYYSGTSRIAYLPHNESGRKLLARLKFAFIHGLTFRVGTSLTTGTPNQITWTSIHHKTNLNYGVHGYPDPQYFTNCNASLDAHRVPKAEDCK